MIDKIFVLLFLIIFSLNSSALDVALTFDDLPSQQNEDFLAQEQINKKILAVLKKYNAPSIGFVCEGKIESSFEKQKKISILKLWLEDGHDLGNHTFSHMNLSTTPLQDFENDLLDGEIISKPLTKNYHKEYKYFRYPYLDEAYGSRKYLKFKVFLKKHGYIVAPVTLDFDDWIFDAQLLKKSHLKNMIIANYLSHVKSKLKLIELTPNQHLRDRTKNILLLHVNYINSIALDSILQLLKDHNHNFITIDEAIAGLVNQDS